MTAMQSGPSRYRPEIDGLRALAILLVIMVHAFPASMSGGFVGVDVFFVISGFLIAGIIFTEMELENFSFTAFYIRRANRIFPALILVLGSSLILGWFTLFAEEFKSLGRSIAAGAGFAANINLYTEVGYWDVSGKFKPLLHLWSLGVEEQFYLAFPCMLWIIRKTKLNPVIALLLCSIASGLWARTSMNSDQAAAFYLPLQRAWELMAGAILAALTRHGADQRSSASSLVHDLAALVGISMILLATFGLDETIPFPGKWSLLPVGGAALIIAAGSNAWINRVVLSNKVVVYVGLISFPLYLWHWPLMSFASILAGGSMSNAILGTALALSFVLACATYHLLEKPLRLSAPSPGARALALTLVLAVLGSIGYVIYKNEGFRSRPIEQHHAADLFIIKRPALAQDDTNPCFKALPDSFKDKFQQGLLPGTLVHCQAKRMEDVSIAMIGDSNAGQYAKDLHDHFGASILTIHSSGRPYVKNINHDETSQTMLSFLAKQASVKTIIIAHLGVELAQGDKPTLGKVQVLTHPQYEQGLIDTIKDFQAEGKRVILLASIPILDFDPKRCEARPLSSLSLTGQCAIARQDIEKTHSPYLAVMKHFRANFSQLEIVDPMNFLCDQKACYAKQNGLILYSDKKHLNSHGSALVTGPVIDLIERAN
jgi:peptidoglycan/LPS O-acetylase OafA/YrhL